MQNAAVGHEILGTPSRVGLIVLGALHVGAVALDAARAIGDPVAGPAAIAAASSAAAPMTDRAAADLTAKSSRTGAICAGAAATS
jgi:hypothetical protein